MTNIAIRSAVSGRLAPSLAAQLEITTRRPCRLPAIAAQTSARRLSWSNSSWLISPWSSSSLPRAISSTPL